MAKGYQLENDDLDEIIVALTEKTEASRANGEIPHTRLYALYRTMERVQKLRNSRGKAPRTRTRKTPITPEAPDGK